MTPRLSRAALAVASLAFAIAAIRAQGPVTEADIHHRTKPADQAELAAITQRGRDLASFDQAAWHATDAVLAINPTQTPGNLYIGQKTTDGWVVAFGRMNATNDAFLLAYEAHPTGDPLHPRIIVNTPPLEDRSAWLFEAKAVSLCRSRISVSIPYNITVLPAPQDGWYVYTYPAQTDMKIFPTGADTRFTVSHDGTTITQTRHLHASLLSTEVNKNTVETYHTAFLDDAPEDTDVANVLMMGGIPMLITAKTFTYRIGADGTASYISPTKVFLKNAKP
jgi:hypothetical protein